MKAIKTITISIFIIILILPMVLFNWQPDCKSEMDNRMLTENPFADVSSVADVSQIGPQMIEYFNDRIGLRNEAIAAYNLINDKFFNLMIHPFYMKGQDDFIFFTKTSNVTFEDYHRNFALMVAAMDRYCKDRGVEFIFVFSPEKLSVMRDKAPVGFNYNNEWKDEFLKILEDNSVAYVDNTAILTQKYKEGEMVFNKQYDAGHWNDLGAFYGVNCILEKMKEFYPDVHINEKDEFVISTQHDVSMQIATMKIEEDTPKFSLKNKAENIARKYKSELVFDKNYHTFFYTKNARVTSPKTLVFQGSYMNKQGNKFMSNALNEYIAVHDYQNVLNFSYYFNIFEPECVVFEVAEYTFLDMYFSKEGVASFNLNPALSTFDGYSVVNRNVNDAVINVESGSVVDNISVSVDLKDISYAYLKINDKEYDLKKTDGEYTLSLSSSVYDKSSLELIFLDEQTKTKYVYS